MLHSVPGLGWPLGWLWMAQGMDACCCISLASILASLQAYSAYPVAHMLL